MQGDLQERYKNTLSHENRKTKEKNLGLSCTCSYHSKNKRLMEKNESFRDKRRCLWKKKFLSLPNSAVAAVLAVHSSFRLSEWFNMSLVLRQCFSHSTVTDSFPQFSTSV